jgi:hypothetical protein
MKRSDFRPKSYRLSHSCCCVRSVSRSLSYRFSAFNSVFSENKLPKRWRWAFNSAFSEIRDATVSGLMMEVIYFVNMQKSTGILWIRAKSLTPPHRREVDARKNKRKLRRVHGNVRRLRGNTGLLKFADFQALKKYPVSVSIP